MPPKKKAVKKSAKNAVEGEVKTYRCTCCGKEVTNTNRVFYQVNYSKSHQGNDHVSHICIDCTRELFDYYRKQYNQAEATKIICAMLDVPFYRSLYDSIQRLHDDFNFGYYIRQTNQRQYQGKTFALTLHAGELEVTKKEAEEEAVELSERNWTTEEKRAKNEVLNLMGYDPFDGYNPRIRRKLFTELLGYLDDDEILSDNYKIAQIIQIINNNEQINQYDIGISKLDPKVDIDEIKTLSGLKKELVAANEKIARENGISVKSRGEQRVGKGTLTGLMRDMREKDIHEAEVNFYNQLQSEASKWATNISMQSMMDNIQLGENDVNEIIEEQRKLLLDYQNENDILKEEKRLLKVGEQKMQERIKQLEEVLGDNVPPYDERDNMDDTSVGGDTG